jgi:membrane protease YdiL (CAAX protease family)
MRQILLLLIYLVVVFGGGALVAPELYESVQWAAGRWAAMGKLAGSPFSRYVLRSVLGLAVILLWPLLRGCGMLKAREMGLAGNGRIVREFVSGFFVGFGSLAAAAGLAIVCGGRSANLGRPDFTHVLLGAATTAIVVAVLEELIFRAALFGILRKAFPWAVALVISSAVYASLHFIQKPPTPSHLDWLSGFRILPQMLDLSGVSISPAVFTLFLAGSALALAYQRTSALFMSIGLHAGWIFWLTTYRSLTRDASGASQLWWGSDKLIDGWIPCLILGMVLVGVWRWCAPGGKASK